MKFYQKTWFIILMLIFFFPVGLFLMWRYSTWGKVPKAIITAIFAWVVYIGVTAPPPPPKDTAAQTKPAVKTEQPKAQEKVKEPEAKPVPDKAPEVKPPEEKKPEPKKEETKPAPKSQFDAAIKLTTDDLTNKEFFPNTKSVSIKVDEDEKTVVMMAVMNDGLKKFVALDFADSMIRQFSSSVSMLNKKWSMPTKDSYGSLFDEYKIQIGVAPQSQVNNPDKWYYMQWIYPGMHTKQGPNWKEAQKKGE